eukprot:416621-Prorocentrum_minimum.AAC.2
MGGGTSKGFEADDARGPPTEDVSSSFFVTKDPEKPEVANGAPPFPVSEPLISTRLRQIDTKKASKSDLINHIDYLMTVIRDRDGDALQIHHLEQSAVDMATRLQMLTEKSSNTALARPRATRRPKNSVTLRIIIRTCFTGARGSIVSTDKDTEPAAVRRSTRDNRADRSHTKERKQTNKHTDTESTD